MQEAAEPTPSRRRQDDKRGNVSDELLQRGAQLDRYEIRELIGRGGMGEVYRAWDLVLHRDVAVKVLTIRDDDMLRRFEREAEAIGRLENENIVQIHDFKVTEGHPYIVMEYLRGETLVDRLKRGAMPVTDAVEVGLGICHGVSACHGVGIVHRDLKPGNVLLAESAFYGRVVKVLDFGVSKPLRVGEDLTGLGQLVGTPRYVSPEQLRGLDADELSDQYGIGLLLHTMLTGRPPFRGLEKKELAHAIVRGQHPRLREQRPEIPEALEALIFTALSPDRKSRFPTVTALGKALLEHASSEGQEGRQFGAEDRSEPAQPVTNDPVTKPERRGALDEGTATEVMSAEVLESLVSGEDSGREKVGGPIVVPVGPMMSERQRAEIAHLMSSTRVDSSLVPKVREPTVTHAGGVLETPEKPKPKARRETAILPPRPSSRKASPVRWRMAVLGAAAVLAFALAGMVWLWLRGQPSPEPARWTTTVLPDDDVVSGTALDGGSDGRDDAQKGNAPPAEAQRVDHVDEDLERRTDVTEPRSGAAEPRRTALPKTKTQRKWNRLEYTKDGSPILW